MVLSYMSATWEDSRHKHRREHVALDFTRKLVRFHSTLKATGEVTDSRWHGRWMYVAPYEIIVYIHYKGATAPYLHAVRLLRDAHNPNIYRGKNYPVIMTVEGYKDSDSDFLLPPMPPRVHEQRSVL